MVDGKWSTKYNWIAEYDVRFPLPQIDAKVLMNGYRFRRLWKGFLSARDLVALKYMRVRDYESEFVIILKIWK